MQQRYHTNLKIKYALGFLEADTAKHIPASTKQYWKNTDINSYFGYDDPHWDKSLETIKYTYKRKSIFRFIRMIKTVETTVTTVIDTIKKPAKLYKDCRATIVNTVDKIKEVTGFNRALDIFKITQHQYRFWKKDTVCKSSPIQLCRKIYYNQLSLYELTQLKNTLFNLNTLH